MNFSVWLTGSRASWTEIIAFRQRTLATLALAIGIAFASLLMPRDSYCADAPAPLPLETARPGATTGPTEVSVGVWVGDISRIDSVAQTFSASFGLLLSWRDPALAHNEPGLKRYNLSDVWHPRWQIFNETAPSTYSLPQVIEVQSDGTVIYRQRISGTYAQSLNLRAFPFDHAIFHIRFAMIGQLPTEIRFVPHKRFVEQGMPTGAGIAPEPTLKDWRVSDPAIRALPYPFGPRAQIAGFAFEFRADRLVEHYLVKVILPLLLIVIMSCSAFWIHPKLGATQISIPVTAMLTLIAYRFSVGADVPKLPYLTHLDAFILISSVLVLLTIIESVVTTTLVSNDQIDRARKIDWHSRWIFPAAYIVVTVVTLFR